MTRRREAIAFSATAPMPIEGMQGLALGEGVSEFLALSQSAGKAPRDPLLDDMQWLEAQPQFQRLMERLLDSTLRAQVRVLPHKGMTREQTQDFALYREGQNSIATALINMMRAANEQPLLARDNFIA